MLPSYVSKTISSTPWGEYLNIQGSLCDIYFSGLQVSLQMGSKVTVGLGIRRTSHRQLTLDLHETMQASTGYCQAQNILYQMCYVFLIFILTIYFNALFQHKIV